LLERINRKQSRANPSGLPAFPEKCDAYDGCADGAKHNALPANGLPFDKQVFSEHLAGAETG
jgi:hypothetical protein